MTSEAAILVRGARKTFGDRRALDAVSLTVAPGEMIGLIGPSGSGKSTLLRAMTGLTVLDAEGGGSVEALGRPVQANGRVSDQIRGVRAGVGMIFQQFNLVERLSLYTNVALGMLGRIGPWRGLVGAWPAGEVRGVMQAIARVGLSDYAGQRAGSLSGGQQQRAAIARALVQKARVILADEPVASLDPVSARQVMDLLVQLNRADGISVVVSLHQVDYAIRYCPRIVALKAGKVVYDGPAKELHHAALVEIYGPEIEDVFWETQAS